MNEIIATGRRKEARATVRVTPGTGKIIINKKDFKDYFKFESFVFDVMKPLEITNLVGKLDIKVTAKGGGASGQKDAVIHGIARALVKMEPNLRKVLKDAGFLKRDPRMVERKKYGRPKARKRFQFSKR
uniref:Small ribosomal subunit protein uS9 n=1 Tax=candidate division WOR-3 bacterium TaxID=2052148 RepID=A0A7C4UAD3_UNCW3